MSELPTRPAAAFDDPNHDRDRYHKETEKALHDLMGVEIEVDTPATPDTEFQLQHKARVVPRSVETLLSTTGGIAYATRLSEWNDRRVFLKFTKGSDSILIRLR